MGLTDMLNRKKNNPDIDLESARTTLTEVEAAYGAAPTVANYTRLTEARVLLDQATVIERAYAKEQAAAEARRAEEERAAKKRRFDGAQAKSHSLDSALAPLVARFVEIDRESAALREKAEAILNAQIEASHEATALAAELGIEIDPNNPIGTPSHMGSVRFRVLDALKKAAIDQGRRCSLEWWLGVE